MLGLNVLRDQGMFHLNNQMTSLMSLRVKHFFSSLLFLIIGLFPILANAGQVEAHLTYAVTNNPVTDKVVTAYQVQSSGSLSWYSQKTTDQNGRATFTLENLGLGSEYVLQATVYNNFRVSSRTLNSEAAVEMPFGTTRIIVRDGTDVNFPLLINKKIDMYQLSSTDVKTYFRTIYTDTSGLLMVDLPNIDAGQRYTLAAQSALSGKVKYSQALTNSGVHHFVVGTRPLDVTLTDAISLQPVDSKRIDVYKIDEQGNSTWYTKGDTDGLGKVSFDLDNLGTGTNYQLKTLAFNGRYALSPVINTLKAFVFKIGSVVVNMQNGTLATPPPLINTQLTISRKSQDMYEWFDSIVSDDLGRVRLDLPGLAEGTTVYRLSAASLINGSMKHSEDLTQPGVVNFVVGNLGIAVTLSNQLTSVVYPNEEIIAYSIDEMGNQKWVSSNMTDAMGKTIFDFEKIDQGQTYIFRVNKFISGSSYSGIVSSYDNVDFTIGAIPLSLINKETSLGLANIEVTAYQILADGQLIWTKSAKTNSAGLLTFDLAGLAQGQRFVFKATSPFGQSKSYYGPVVLTAGQIDFYLKEGQFDILDLVAPTIDIDTPSKSIAHAGGFSVAGQVADDQAIEHIEVVVIDSVLGQHKFNAVHDEVNQRWQAAIEGSWISGGTVANVTATVVDYSNNRTSVSKNYSITEDIAPPVIEFTSHQANDLVDVTGFTLMGIVTDDVDVVAIDATLNDPLLGETISAQSLNISGQDGQWALPVIKGKISLNQPVTITLKATDVSGKTTLAVLTLTTKTISKTPVYLAQRITFGVTPQILASIKQGDDILTQQLNPDSIDDTQFEIDMAAMVVETRSDLKYYLLSYMAGSKKQLREVMAWFWENHFSTNVNSHGYPSYELAENKLFRQHALGSFRALLEASSKSAAMIRYLSSSQNVIGRPNENYAREVMELHTVGVNGGYTATDVAELSRMFTGWHEKEGVFTFNESLHDQGSKEFLGHTIAAAGANEGEQALDILASHPKTGYFICSKLITLFVSEQTSEQLLGECAAEFMSSEGNISEVLKVIFNDPQFTTGQDYRSKIKTPLELLLSTVRSFGAVITPKQMSEHLSAMSMPIFEFSLPTGFSEIGEDWLSSNAIVQRMRLVNQMTRDNIDFKQLLLAKGISSAEAIVSHLFEVALFNDFTQLEYNLALSILNAKQPFDMNRPDANDKLNRLLGTVLSFPSFQYQ